MSIAKALANLCQGVSLDDTPELERSRDARISLDETTHVYHCDAATDFMSVTTWNHSHFAEFVAAEVVEKVLDGENDKYQGMSRDEILEAWSKEASEASQAGTSLHQAIECYYKTGKLPPTPMSETVEWSHFMKFVHDHQHLRPYKSEWRVFDEDLKLAGTIDMTFTSGNDRNIMIYDWKRSKRIVKANPWQHALTPEISHLQDCNFWHYALQLNTYKFILERRYQRKVSAMFIVVMHPDNESGTYELDEMPNLTRELDLLMQVRMDMLAWPTYVTSIGEVLKCQGWILTFMSGHKSLKVKLRTLTSTFKSLSGGLQGHVCAAPKFFDMALLDLVQKGMLQIDPLCLEVWVSNSGLR